MLVDESGDAFADTLPWQDFCDIPEGRQLTDVARLDIPADAPGGANQLVLEVNDIESVIGALKVSYVLHSFTLPDMITIPMHQDAASIATLVGYTIGDANVTTLQSEVPVSVTLIWQALGDANAHDLKAFVHLYAPDGSIIAQHDGIPVDWTRPTSGWVEGEYIVDTHALQWQRAYQGDAHLAVGLYDPATGERVVWDNGQDVLSLADIKVE